MPYTDTVVPIEKIREAVATYGRPARETSFHCPKSFELWRLRDRLLLFTMLEICRRIRIHRNNPEYYKIIDEELSSFSGHSRLCRFPLERKMDGRYWRRLTDKSYLDSVTHRKWKPAGPKTGKYFLHFDIKQNLRLDRNVRRIILEVKRKKAILVPNTFVVQAWKDKLSAYGVRLYIFLLSTRRRRDEYSRTVITYERLRRCGISTGKRDVKRDRAETRKALQTLKGMNLVTSFTEDSKSLHVLFRENR